MPAPTLNARACCRILLVDDDAVTRHLLRAMLREEPGLEVIGEANNGLTAMEQVERLAPDLVCLDLQMPQLDGFAVLKTLRAGYPGVKVLILSGAPTSEAVSQVVEHGASGFLVKPFNAARATAAIRSAVAGAMTPPAGAPAGEKTNE